jgi:elongation factor G
MGSAYKNKGVQLLLDAVVTTCPSPPTSRTPGGGPRPNDEAPVELSRPRRSRPWPRLQARGGPLRAAHLHPRLPGHAGQGRIRSSTPAPARSIKVGRLVRMHADEMEDIESAGAGDIVACSASTATPATPSPTARRTRDDLDARARAGDLALDQAEGQQGPGQHVQGAHRFTKEDPTFRVTRRPGEQRDHHLRHGRAAPRRLRRAHEARVLGEVETGAPQVAYRETISRRADFDYTHKKQTGGSGQYGKVVGYIEPLDRRLRVRERDPRRPHPHRVHPGGARRASARARQGALIGFPVVGVRVGAQRRAVPRGGLVGHGVPDGRARRLPRRLPKAKPQILEPVMKVSVEGPTEFQGAC